MFKKNADFDSFAAPQSFMSDSDLMKCGESAERGSLPTPRMELRSPCSTKERPQNVTEKVTQVKGWKPNFSTF